MARPPAGKDPYLLSKISALYYHRGQTQQEIADRFHISRPRVSQLLKEAEQLGIVQVLVRPPQGIHVDLEDALEERFGVPEVLVAELEDEDSYRMLRHQIGNAAAAYLARTLEAGQTIGVAWGPTLSAFVQAVAPLASSDLRVVQLFGGIGAPEAEAYATETARSLAQTLGATAALIPAPGVVPNTDVRDTLVTDRHVRSTLNEIDEVDMAFVGIGRVTHAPSVHDDSSVMSEIRQRMEYEGVVGDIMLRFYDAVDTGEDNPLVREGTSWIPGLLSRLAEARAVGDILLRFYDIDGDVIPTLLDGLLIGISLDQLRRIPRLVALAGGLHKVDAITGALRSGLIDALVIDRPTAQALLDTPAP